MRRNPTDPPELGRHAGAGGWADPTVPWVPSRLDLGDRTMALGLGLSRYPDLIEWDARSMQRNDSGGAGSRSGSEPGLPTATVAGPSPAVGSPLSPADVFLQHAAYVEEFEGAPVDDILPGLAALEGWHATWWGLFHHATTSDGRKLAFLYMLPRGAMSSLVGPNPVELRFVMVSERRLGDPAPSVAAPPREFFAGRRVLHWFEGSRTLDWAVTLNGVAGGTGATTGVGTAAAPASAQAIASVRLDYDVRLYSRSLGDVAPTLQGSASGRSNPSVPVDPNFAVGAMGLAEITITPLGQAAAVYDQDDAALDWSWDGHYPEVCTALTGAATQGYWCVMYSAAGPTLDKMNAGGSPLTIGETPCTTGVALMTLFGFGPANGERDLMCRTACVDFQQRLGTDTQFSLSEGCPGTVMWTDPGQAQQP